MRNRDAYEGQKAVKAAGETYLPKLGGQTDADYRAYKTRALFYGITGKTISAMVGMAMSRDPSIEASSSLDVYFKDKNGLQFYELLKQTITESLLVGRFGVLLDRPVDGGAIKILPYKAESIINWKLNEYGVPELVVLREYVVKQALGDRFEFETVIQYRALYLDDDGIYTVEIYDDGLGLVLAEQPRLSGTTIDFIPFFIMSSSGIGWDLEKAPITDIVDINISHYLSSADLEHGRHWTGLPTPVVSGTDDSDVTLNIGSQSAWILPNEKSKAYMLEFTGQGLESLEKALTEKQSQLASMSARLMDNSSRGSESEGVVRLRYSSETATLISIVQTCETFLQMIFEVIAKLDAVDDENLSIKLSKEFLDTRLSGSDLTTIFNGYFDGAISAETLIFNLRRGDILSMDKSDDEEVAELKQRSIDRLSIAAQNQTQKE